MPDEFMLIETAADAPGQPAPNPRVIGLAYGGGKINLPGWRHPVVVDLAGLELPESVPLLANHENRTTARVGMVRARVVNGTLEIEGEIVATGDLADDIVRQAKAGADWQLSIGAEVRASELIRQGVSREVNGRVQHGPFYLVAKAALREVSVVAVGADGTTKLKVAASFTLLGEMAMEQPLDPTFAAWLKESGIEAEGLAAAMLDKLELAFKAERKTAPGAKPDTGKPDPATVTAAATPPAADKNPPAPKPDAVASAASAASGVPAPAAPPVPADLTAAADPQAVAVAAVAAERERIAGIQAVCAGDYPDIEREAIRANWSADDAGREVLKRIRASRPAPDARVAAFAAANKPDTVKTIEAALCLRTGLNADALAKEYGEPVLDAAYRDRQISMQEIFARCLRMEGKFFSSFDNEAIRAAFSTVSLPGILSNVANKRLLRSFESQPLVATRLCREGDLSNFNEAQRYRLTDVGDLEPVAADGELKHGSMKEEQASNQIDTWGKSFTLTRKMIINDDLGSFMTIPTALGARAARKIDVLFFQRLLKNPNGLFSDKHNNFKSGPDTALGHESLALAIQMFQDQTDADGQPINIQPKFLLVPTSLKVAARELLNSVTFTAVGGGDKIRVPTYNALKDEELEVVSAAYLSNKNYTGWSPKAWYLFGDPQILDTFEIGYLKGQRTPTVEKTSVDFEKLGMRFRVYFDLGVREQDHRGIVKFAGQ